MRRFKLDRKGFTLIELLAVITILGILMLILIPSVSRIIENSRKNTFLSTAKNYANAVRDAWSGDQLYCLTGTETTPHLASSLSTGTFIVMIASDPSGYKYTGLPTSYSSSNSAVQNFKQLINSGGRSSWGNNEVGGYVKIVVTTQNVTISGLSGSSETTQLYDYYVELIDTQGHGLPIGTVTIDSVLRQSIVTTGGTQAAPTAAASPANKLYYCLVS